MFELLKQLLLILFLPTVDSANVAITEAWGHDDMLVCDDNELSLATCQLEPCDQHPIFEQDPSCKERMRWALLTISNRESAGHWSPDRRYTGVHNRDSKHADNVFRWAKKFGRLSGWCPSHWSSEGMSTVGPHGLMYGYNVQRLLVPGNCVPTWAFGIGTVSARAAAQRYLSQCHTPRPGDRWCPNTEQILRTKTKARRLAWRKRRKERIL